MQSDSIISETQKVPPVTYKLPKKCKACKCAECNKQQESVIYLLSVVAELKNQMSNFDNSMKEDTAEKLNSMVKTQTENSQVKFQARLQSVEKKISSTVVNAKAKEESIQEVEERKKGKLILLFMESQNLAKLTQNKDVKMTKPSSVKL
jgi:signal-transduction protein with cAMP-binding, CBS, and nucleotidyltransferase domain